MRGRRAGIVSLGVALLAGCRESSFDVAGALQRGRVENPGYHRKLSFETVASLMTLPVRVGTRECRMVLDTGAPMTVSADLARELELPVVGTFPTRDTTGREQLREFVALPSLEIAGIRYSDLVAVVIDLRGFGEFRAGNIEGLVGGNLLRLGALKIDFAAKTLELTDDLARVLPEGGASFDFVDSAQGTPLLELGVGSLKVRDVKLDTGSNGFLTLPASLVDRAAPNQCVDFAGSARSGAFGEAPENGRICWLDGVALGDTALGGMVVDSLAAGQPSAGARFFERTQLVLDWRARKAYVADPALLGRQELLAYGLGIRQFDGAVRVGFVIAGSSAARAQLAPGQKVLSVEDVDLSANRDADYLRAADLLRDESLAVVRVVVESNGDPVERKLEREPLLPRPPAGDARSFVPPRTPPGE